MEHCDKHGPYSVLCRQCDLEVIAAHEATPPDDLTVLRAMLSAQAWAKDWTHNIVPPGKPAHELACTAIRALPALLDRIEQQAEVIGKLREALAEACGLIPYCDGATAVRLRAALKDSAPPPSPEE